MKGDLGFGLLLGVAGLCLGFFLGAIYGGAAPWRPAATAVVAQADDPIADAFRAAALAENRPHDPALRAGLQQLAERIGTAQKPVVAHRTRAPSAGEGEPETTGSTGR